MDPILFILHHYVTSSSVLSRRLCVEFANDFGRTHRSYLFLGGAFLMTHT